MTSKAKSRAKKDEQLDHALEETFPASDPVASGQSTGTEASGRPTDRKAPVISKEEIEMARKGRGHKQ